MIWAVLLASAAAAATEAPQTGSLLDYGGLLLGGAVSSTNPSLEPSFGIEGGLQLTAELGVGVYVGYSPRRPVNVDDNSGVYTFAAEGNYFADKLFPGARIGLKAGVACSDFVHLTAGPLIGYDYALGNGVSIGGEASTLLVTTTPWSESTQLLMIVRYWF